MSIISIMLKSKGKKLLCLALEAQVRKLCQRNSLTVIAVAGSVGKTSTKLAIAKVLAGSRRVIYQEGNYNDRLTVPLVLFGQVKPGLFNILAWFRLLWRNSQQLKRPYPYDIAVLEFGTDAPGQIKDFAYLKPDITVVTAVAAEHMENFDSIDAVAAEELSVFDFSRQIVVNSDDVAGKYLDGFTYKSYGVHGKPDYEVTQSEEISLNGQKLTFTLPAHRKFHTATHFLGEQGAKIAAAAVACADIHDMPLEDIRSALSQLKPFAGRMQILDGADGSILIDDTYNASPIAVRAALQTLYEVPAKQRIAILGSMNELGETSAAEHKTVGQFCDPKKLALVVTIGSEAEKYLAPAAAAKGCEVKSFMNPYDAGEFVKQKLGVGSVVLAKGSQNGVFAEEALKTLLADKSDESKLVRQSAYWLSVKRRQFGD